MRSEASEEPSCLPVQDNSRYLHGVEVPGSLTNDLTHVPPVQAADRLNTNSEESCLKEGLEKGTVEKITLIKKARTKPENNSSDHMFEIKSSRGEEASSSMQEDCESGCSVGLSENSSTAFTDDSPVIADTTDLSPKGGRFIKASKKGPVKKRTSFRNLVGRPDNSNHFLNIESEIDGTRCSLQEDGQSHCHQELPENLCTPYPSVTPFSIENIDMRTREGRMLKASIKEQVKQITLIKRAQKRPEKNILDHACEIMKCGSVAVAPSAQEDFIPRCSVDMPDDQCNALLEAQPAQPANAKNSKAVTGESYLSICEMEDVKKSPLARKARKRPWKNVESVHVGEGASSVYVSESSSNVVTSENLCDTLRNVPIIAVEHLNTKAHEGHLPKAETKGEVKKTTSVKEVRKRPAKISLVSTLEMKSGVGKDSSSTVQELTESCGSVELSERLCEAVSEIPLNTAVNLHTNIEVSRLPGIDAKEEGKIYVNPVHKRPAKNNFDHLLEIGSESGDHISLVQNDTKSHCSAKRSENLCCIFRADAVHRLHANAEDPLLKADASSKVKKVTFMKKNRKNTENNNLDTPLEVGSGAIDGASSVQYDVDSFPDAPTDTVVGLHNSAEEAFLLNAGSKGAVKKMTLIKKARNRLQKVDSDNLLEMKSGMGFESHSTEKESSKSSCSFEPRENQIGADLLPQHAKNIYTNIKETSLLKESKKGEVTKNTSVKNVRKRPANNSDQIEIKNASVENTTKLQEDSRSHCNIEPSENRCRSLPEVQADASEQLNIKAGVACMSNLSDKPAGQLVPILKNARKRPVKNNTKYVSAEDVSLSQGVPQSQCSIKLLENLSAFPVLPTVDREHLPTISEAEIMETKGVVKKIAVVKNPRKRTEKNSDPNLDKVSGSCGAALLGQSSSKHSFGDKLSENTPDAFQGVPPHRAVHFNANRDVDSLLKMGNKGQGKQVPAVDKARKRPPKNHFDQVLEIESGKGENASSIVEDSMTKGSAGLPKGLYKAITNVPAVPAEQTQVKKEEGCLFTPVAKRAVKKMTLSQKPRTGLEKDSERVLQMKSERVDDGCYLVQNDSVFRYSVELPESLCSDFPAAPPPQHTSDAMDISTDGGRLCLFTAAKKEIAKKKPSLKKTSIRPEETLSDHPHEIEIELGEDASSSVLGDSESLCGLDLAESSCSAFPDVSSDTLENVNMGTGEACFLKASQKGSVGKMTLMQNAETGVVELDRLFAVESEGHADALVQDDSHSSFEIEEVLGSDFSSVLPHAADGTDLGMEEGILLDDSTKELMKKRSQIKASPRPQESHLDHERQMKSGTDEELGALLHEDSESHFSVEVPGSPGVSPHTVEDVDLSTETDLVGLFQPSRNVEEDPVVIKQETGPEDSTSEPLLKRRGRKKKEPEMEILPNGEIRVKKKPRLSTKDREPRKRGRRSESGLSNDGAPDGETNLDFGEIFDAVLAEASKWERMRDTEGLTHLGLEEGLSGTGRLTAPPLSDNDLYSSADETEGAFFGYPHAYEQDKFTSIKKHKDLIEKAQVEKRKTSPYFAKQFTEGEQKSRDDLPGGGEDTLSGYEDASDEYLEQLLTDTDGDSEDLDLGQFSAPSYNGAGPSGLHLTPSPGNTLPGLEVNCKTVEGAILKTEQKQLSVVKNINDHLRRMERHLAHLVKFNRLYIRRSLGLTGELVRENASQSLSLQRIAETLESAIPFPTASGVRITAEVAPSSSSSTVSSDSSDEEWAKRPSKTPKRAKRSREDGMGKKRKKK